MNGLVIVTTCWYDNINQRQASQNRKESEMAGSYSLGEHFDNFVKAQVASGRYNNESEVVRDALRFAELRDLKLKALREHVHNAVKSGGSYTDDDIAAILAADVE